MSITTWSEADSIRASELWEQYQRDHDVSSQVGRAVGIDPESGHVWFGESAEEIVRQRDAVGLSTPLYFLRVGQDYYQRKGGRR
jgi:hypothetical protein